MKSHVMLCFLMTTMGCLSGTTVLNRLGLGAILHPVPPIQLQVNPWKHIFKIEVPTYIPKLRYRRLCTYLDDLDTPEFQDVIHKRYIETICNTHREIANVSRQLVRAVMEDIRTTRDAILVVLQDTVATYRATHLDPAGVPWRRKKRLAGAILAGVAGLFAGTLFSNSASRGVEDKVDNVRDYVKDIEQRLKATQEAQVQHFQHLSSVMDLTGRGLNASNVRIQALENIVPKLIEGLTKIQDKLDKTNSRIRGVSLAFHLSVLQEAYTMMTTDQLPQALNQYLSYMRQFLLSIQTLTTGRLPPGMVSPEHLRMAVREIKDALMDRLPGYTLGISGIENLYHVPLESVIVANKSLYITMAIPIARQASIYDVYHIQPFQRLAGDPEDHRYTLLVGLPDYLAITGEYFVEMTQAEYAQCIGDVSLRVCFTPFLEHDFEQMTCALALFLDKPQEAAELCRVDYIINRRPLDIIVPIGPAQLYIISLATQDTWTFSCVGRRPKVEKSCENCLVTLPCACSFRTKNTYYQGALVGCDQYNSTTVVDHRKYIKNILYLTKVAESPRYQEAMRETLTTDPLSATGPSLELPEFVLPVTAQQESQEVIMDFSKLMVQLKTQENIYRNKTEGGLRPVLYEGYRSDWSLYMSIASGALGGMLTIMLAIQCYRHAGLKQSLAVLFSMRNQQVRGAIIEAQTQPCDLPEYSHTLMAIAISGYLVWNIFKFVRRLYRNRNILYRGPRSVGRETLGGRACNVLLEIGNNVEFSVLFLQTVRGSPGQYQLMGPPVRDLETYPSFTKVKRCWNEHLAINWRRYVLFNMSCGLKTELSPAAKIPFLEQNRVGRILKGPMVIRILIGSVGIYEAFMISAPQRFPFQDTGSESEYEDLHTRPQSVSVFPGELSKMYPVLPAVAPPVPPPKEKKKKRRHSKSLSMVMMSGLAVPSAPPEMEPI